MVGQERELKLGENWAPGVSSLALVPMPDLAQL